MISFIADNIATIIIGALLAFAVAMIIRKMVRDKKQGIPSSCSGCKGCANASSCRSKQQ